MADSDGEYVENVTDDELDDHQVTTGEVSYGTRSTTLPSRSGRAPGRRKDRRTGDGGGGGGGKRAAWEDIQRSWDTVVEGADGNISVGKLLEAEKRRRLLRDTTPLQRGIIRHMMLVVDMSFAMAEKDLLPNRYRVTIQMAIEFVREYFEQNPISQLGVLGMRDGVAVRISDMSGNPTEHIEKLREWLPQEPQGNPSLQNVLEMCRGALYHAPSHGTREVLIVYGALLSSDPGDIHDTIESLITDRIRVSIIGLAAQVAICAELCSRTNDGSAEHYAVALHEQHLRELLLAATTPPLTRTVEQSLASLLLMGFPSRTVSDRDTISACTCHNRPCREGYVCTRCKAKVCRLPAECPVCGLTLVLSTHLARSYHHLFPLRNWVEVPWSEAGQSKACFACLSPFPLVDAKGKGKAIPNGRNGTARGEVDEVTPETKGLSESGRYKCEVCGHHFCIDCDVYAHEVVHNCPGCQSESGARPMMVEIPDGIEEVNGTNGNSHANGDMVIDP